MIWSESLRKDTSPNSVHSLLNFYHPYGLVAILNSKVVVSDSPLYAGPAEAIGHLGGGLRPPLIKKSPNSNNILYIII